MKEKNFVSAVVYVHNCEERIAGFLQKVYSELKLHFEKFEIICVDDGSEDASQEVIRKIADQFCDTTVTILKMSYFQGMERAMNAGVDLTIGDFVYEFDSTIMDYDDTLIFSIYKKSLEGYDIVSAAMSGENSVASACFYKLFSHFSLYNDSMQTESFRILSRRAINRCVSLNKTIPYRKAVYANCGLEHCCIRYESTNTSKRDLGKREKDYRKNLAVDSLILFTDAGYRISIGMTGIMVLVAVLTAMYALVVFLLGNPVEGWTTTMLFLAFGFGGVFSLLSIVIKYLSLLVNLIFQKQQYRFSGIEKITK